jgi:choice-of-anchor C domain-containing protein
MRFSNGEMMKKLFNILFSILLITALLTAPAAAAIVQNGSFENGTVPPVSGFETLGAGSDDLVGWYLGYRSIDWIGNYWQPFDGARSVDLNGNTRGWIAQTLSTSPGTAYRVTFALAGNPDGGDPVKDLIVTALGIGSRSYSFDTTGKSRSAMGWVVEEFNFTATSNSTILVFASGERGPYGPALDKIEAAPVPIPAAVWLLATGLFGLATLRRRMRK